MKKSIIFLITFVLLCSMAFSAQPPIPAPVKGAVYINGEALSGLGVVVVNGRTGEQITYETIPSLKTEDGIYVFDMSQFKQGYSTSIPGIYEGDKITIKVAGYEVSFNAVEFPFVAPQIGVYVPPVVKDPVTVIEKEVVVEKEIIVEKEVMVDDEDGSMSLIVSLLLVAMGILTAFGWGKGFVGLANYYKKKGDEAKKNGDKALANKYYKRAAKMLSTSLKKAALGKYKRD